LRRSTPTAPRISWAGSAAAGRRGCPCPPTLSAASCAGPVPPASSRPRWCPRAPTMDAALRTTRSFCNQATSRRPTPTGATPEAPPSFSSCRDPSRPGSMSARLARSRLSAGAGGHWAVAATRTPPQVQPPPGRSPRAGPRAATRDVRPERRVSRFASGAQPQRVCVRGALFFLLYITFCPGCWHALYCTSLGLTSHATTCMPPPACG